MRVVLDACVLFPSVLRSLLLRAAEAGMFEPVWSDRIIEEWQRAALRLGPDAVADAEMDARAMRVAFPRAMARARPDIEAQHILPDPNDLHVLACAIGSGADAILTFNAVDFPRHVLQAEQLDRRDPDGFLWELWSRAPDKMGAIIHDLHVEAERRAGAPVSLKALLRRNRLNRLAKAIDAQGLPASS